MKKRQITRGTIRKRVPKKKGIDLSQRYIKQSKLGQGAFGLVYSAFDQETSKIVAIKCLTNKDSIDSFKDELDLLKRLHHSAIVPYLDSFLDSKGSLQIVMEYAEGGSLLDIIHKYGTLNEQVAAIYVSQILKGLVYLHKQNVIHRDIKAANVLFQGGIAKLADFGLALDLNDYGHTLRECAGSPYWMAPEVINNDPVNQKSDIWSVGATTYELLKGYPPFFEMAPVPAMFQIAGPRPMPIPHDISELCYDFLSQCFQKDPKLRPEAITLLKHPWIQQSLQYVEQIEGSFTNKNKKQSQDFKKLSLRLESICKTITTTQLQLSPEETILLLNNEKDYLQALSTTIKLLKTKKHIPELIINLCGVRMLIERLEKEEFYIPTLNLIQLLIEQSEKIATSLIEHCLLEKFFNEENILFKLVALLIIIKSSKGFKLFAANGLLKYMKQFSKIPILTIFIPTFLNLLIDSTLPKCLIIKTFDEELITSIINITFKSIIKFDEYQKILNSTFRSLNSDFLSDNLNIPHLSSFFFEKSKTFITDSLLLNIKVLPLNSIIKLKYTEHIQPLIYLIKKFGNNKKLKIKLYHRNINNFRYSFSDFLCKDKINGISLIEPIITFGFSDDIKLSTTSIKCLTKMIRYKPILFEKAVDSGLCTLIINSISKNISLSFIYELLCLLPTISKFTAYRAQKSGLFSSLKSLLLLNEWQDKAIHTLSIWMNFNPLYINQELMNTNVIKLIYNILLNRIEMAFNSFVKINFFKDIKVIIQNSNYFALKTLDNELMNKLVDLVNVNKKENGVVFMEIINEYVIQSQNPRRIANEIIRNFVGLTESDNFDLQRAALHLRVLSGE